MIFLLFPLPSDTMNVRFDSILIFNSASLPMISPILNIKGGEYLDGGIADSIPILKSIKDGNKKSAR